MADQIELATGLVKPQGQNPMSAESEWSIWDDWAIGYIAGAVDGAMQSYSMAPSHPVGPLIMQGAFQRLFNNPSINHTQLIERGLDMINARTRSAELGAKDTMRLLEFRHSNKEEDPSSEVMYHNVPNLLQTYLMLGPEEAASIAESNRGFTLRPGAPDASPKPVRTTSDVATRRVNATPHTSSGSGVGFIVAATALILVVVGFTFIS